MSGNGHSKKDPVLVIVQLSGGNDFMNTLVPYNEGHYYDARPLVGVPQDEVMRSTTNSASIPPPSG